MKTIKIDKKNLIYGATILIIGILFGWLLFGGNGESNSNKTAEHQHGQTEQSTIWTCSMHPQIRQEKSGQCPICGMDLIAMDDNSGGEEAMPGELRMTKAAMKLAEVQTAIVNRQQPEKIVHLLGKVKPDERLIYSQTSHIPGRIEKLYINFTGEKVRKGQRLASIYSPELLTAQKELFEVLKDQTSNPYLVDAARNKLKLWKFTDKQIRNLEENGELQTEIDILSEYNGYVFMRHVALGDHIMEGQSLFKIVNLSKIWVMFEAYESDLPWIKVGDKVEIEIQSLPGKPFKGKVTYIDPFINPQTRIANVRVELPNIGTTLKPDMFANGIIRSKLSANKPVLLIPKSSALWTGKRAVVYVKIPNRNQPTFIYREIILGEDAGDSYIVKSGLEEGEEIATNGVFRIDAASQLAGKPSMMNPEGMDGKKETDVEKEKVKSYQKIKKDNISVIFKQQLGAVVGDYLTLKDALVNDDPDKAKEAAKKMASALGKIDMKLLKGDAHMVWMEALELMNNSLNKLSKENDLETQRTVFSNVSNNLSRSIQVLGVKMDNGKTLYLEFCSMANNNKGAYWLSTEKQIQNPYFGQKMLKCGEIKEILN